MAEPKPQGKGKKNLPKIIGGGVVSAAAVLGAIFAVTGPLNIFDREKSEPRVLSVTNSEAKPGEKIRIPGVDLGPVNDVQLVGDKTVQLPVMNLQDSPKTYLTVSIPKDQPTGKYLVEFKTSNGGTRPTGLFLTVIAEAASFSTAPPPPLAGVTPTPLGPTGGGIPTSPGTGPTLTPAAISVAPAMTPRPSPTAMSTPPKLTPTPSPSANPPPNVMAYGQEVISRITVPRGTEDWKFTGQAGEIITIRIFQEGSAALDPGVTLLDPSGKEITYSGCQDDARIQNYALPASADYRIRARSCSGAGGYRLSLSVKPTLADMTYGQEVAGNIALTGDYEDRKFTGQPGDIISIQVLRVGSAALRPGVTLLDPGGVKIATVCGSSSTGIAVVQNHTLRFPGLYTIRATGCSSTTGGYSLSLTKNP